MANKDYGKSEVAELKQIIRTLKGSISSKDRKIRSLKSEVKTLQKALDQSVLYIDESLEDVSIEEVVKFFHDRKSGTMEELHEFSEKAREKWRCFSCAEGHLRLIIINRNDGEYYIRSCTHCDKRTRIKKYTNDVKGDL